MEIAKVGVVGCGTMGSGICEVVAKAGLTVSFVEVTPDRVEAGLDRIRGSLRRAVDRGKLSEGDFDAVVGRISGDTSYETLGDADLVVEAVPERLAMKQDTFRQLDAVMKPDAILATNTSSLPVTDIAVTTHRASRILGFHFFNPAPVMKLIELVTTVVTDEQVIADAKAFAERIGKTPVVAKDRAGFVANLLLFPYLNQAVGMLESGYATREDIDAAMQLGAGHPMGPLALMDLIGLDSAYAIMMRMYEQFGDTRHAPRPVIRQLLAADFKGRKAGRGFYDYIKPNQPAVEDLRGSGAPTDPDAIAAWSTIGVLGTGTMATGIAEVSAKAGFDVVLRGRTVDKADKAKGVVDTSLGRAVDKGKLDADARDEALNRIATTDDVADFSGCDLVVEAVAEDLALKRDCFAQLDAATKPEAVLATSTSSMSVIDCAMATSRPERVVGLHFFNPAAIMRLVEVVPTVRSDERTVTESRAFATKVGKHPVLCRDRAGFIVNALLFPYLNDAVKMLDEGYATVTDIDRAMKLGCGHPMGPFELMDIVGLDVTLEIVKALHTEFREPGFEPAPLLRHMVSAGYLGRKAGRGFHVYG
ncbi:MAG: 3-hydroxyacyl-CoA dehydrogenase family protein [Nitriliruptorales bacterium]|nr:3-hydroxyacyl-CoA dehydrogenase family protein [Nitriliruptorales bacterium]